MEWIWFGFRLVLTFGRSIYRCLWDTKVDKSKKKTLYIFLIKSYIPDFSLWWWTLYLEDNLLWYACKNEMFLAFVRKLLLSWMFPACLQLVQDGWYPSAVGLFFNKRKIWLLQNILLHQLFLWGNGSQTAKFHFCIKC